MSSGHGKARSTPTCPFWRRNGPRAAVTFRQLRRFRHIINPDKVFGTHSATHFLMKTLPRVAAEMALHVLAYNMTRVMNIMGTKPLIAAMRA